MERLKGRVDLNGVSGKFVEKSRQPFNAITDLVRAVMREAQPGAVSKLAATGKIHPRLEPGLETTGPGADDRGVDGRLEFEPEEIAALGRRESRSRGPDHGPDVGEVLS